MVTTKVGQTTQRLQGRMLCCGRKKKIGGGATPLKTTLAIRTTVALEPPYFTIHGQQVSGISSEMFRQIESIENECDSAAAGAGGGRGEMVVRLLDPKSLGTAAAVAARPWLNLQASESKGHVRLVEIVKRPGQTLGLYIREGNGIDRSDGVFISRIALESSVYNSGCLKMERGSWLYQPPPPPVVTEQPKSHHYTPSYDKPSHPGTLESLAEKVHSFYPGGSSTTPRRMSATTSSGLLSYYGSSSRSKVMPRSGSDQHLPRVEYMDYNSSREPPAYRSSYRSTGPTPSATYSSTLSRRQRSVDYSSDTEASRPSYYYYRQHSSEFLKYKQSVGRTGQADVSGLLWLHLLSGRGLRASTNPSGSTSNLGAGGNSVVRDLYCVLECDGVHKARTVVRTADLVFDWDETFELDLVSNRELDFLIYSWDPQYRHKLCYKGSVQLASLLSESPVHQLAVKIEPRGTLYMRLHHTTPQQTFSRKPKQSIVSRGKTQGIFGTDLETVVNRESIASEILKGDALNIPTIVRRCVEEVERRGLDIIGLYRLCGSATKKRILREAFERSPRTVDLSSDNVPDINVITGVLKDYMRELPEPLVTKCLYQMLADAVSVCLPDDPQGNASLIFSILDCLPHVNRCTFIYLMNHLALVASQQDRNKMSTQALATCFAPVLVLHSETAGQSLDFHGPISVIKYLLDIWPSATGNVRISPQAVDDRFGRGWTVNQELTWESTSGCQYGFRERPKVLQQEFCLVSGFQMCCECNLKLRAHLSHCAHLPLCGSVRIQGERLCQEFRFKFPTLERAPCLPPRPGCAAPAPPPLPAKPKPQVLPTYVTSVTPASPSRTYFLWQVVTSPVTPPSSSDDEYAKSAFDSKANFDSKKSVFERPSQANHHNSLANGGQEHRPLPSSMGVSPTVGQTGPLPASVGQTGPLQTTVGQTSPLQAAMETNGGIFDTESIVGAIVQQGTPSGNHQQPTIVTSSGPTSPPKYTLKVNRNNPFAEDMEAVTPTSGSEVTDGGGGGPGGHDADGENSDDSAQLNDDLK
ncbi:unnamed protein product [Nesidiocoris tenuis]|uniref:Uncharacterized protein n=1 Tax=Nesidiocoris tenuis TaxID=355587 RepID=A0A6H5GGM3_9HEMI|nr:unnamed protein product [Nesidiocoris tenuis]